MQDILDFWFGMTDNPEYGKPRKFWFAKSEGFDEEVKSRFLATYEQAARGELDHWQASPQGSLALIILLDQFPRNMFRNQAQAFATDSKALAIAEQAIKQGFDRQLLPIQRWFVYIPFEHSENLENQRYCLELFSNLQDDPDSASAISYAQLHYNVIERFGRFPHRNVILGRESTPEEEIFLLQPDSSF